MSQLKQIFYDAYDGFADKRIKRLDRYNRFIVDDRSNSDVGANSQLLSYFCMIFADVLSESKIEVAMHGNVPSGSNVRKWISSHECEMQSDELHLNDSLSFVVDEGQQNILTELADAIESIVRYGAPRYDVPSYKYVCPRTAASLRNLKSILETAWVT
jgi:hypothetical protein